MSVTPMPLSRPPPVPPPAARPRPPAPVRAHRTDVSRRSFGVNLAKRLLPLVALGLLCLVGFWPELGQDPTGRFSVHSGGVDVQSGQLTEVRYNGADQRGRPYTMTAAIARQISPERIDLTHPKADLTLESGAWLLLQSAQGVYAPRAAQLDLAGDVVLYRDDGVMLVTDTATVDLKAGVATSAAQVHVEGPFGTLDAQGFTVSDRGSSANFAGPGRLVLNGRQP